MYQVSEKSQEEPLLHAKLCLKTIILAYGSTKFGSDTTTCVPPEAMKLAIAVSVANAATCVDAKFAASCVAVPLSATATCVRSFASCVAVA